MTKSKLPELPNLPKLTDIIEVAGAIKQMGNGVESMASHFSKIVKHGEKVIEGMANIGKIKK